MASLTAHLRQSDDHGRLAFHAQCPVCAQRLAGTLPLEPIVSRRTQAVLAAGVLTLSSASPAAAFAPEPDQEQEGVEQVATAEAPSDSGFDPGGPATDLPFDAAQAPATQIVPDPAGASDPVEQEPVTDEVAPTADTGDGGSTLQPPPTPDPVVPPAPQAAPPTAPTSPPEPATTAPAPTEPGAVTPPGADEREAHKERASRPHSAAPRSGDRKPTPPTVQAPRPVPIYSANAPTAVRIATPSPVATTKPTASSPAATTRSHGAQRGDSFHVVQRDESLWSIASDVLGGDSSPARIAREVNRLWELNSTRIGTGDRDLLMAGTRLELR